jgi:Domain of unknown function (DUF5666)
MLSLVLERGAIAALIATLLAGTPGIAASVLGGPAPLSTGWGWFLAAGTLSCVGPAGRTVTLSIAGQGRMETLESLGRWRRQTMTGVLVVHLLPATVISNGEGVPLAAGALHPAVPATVWGAVRPDSSAVALKIVMAAASPKAPLPPSANPYALSGAVLRASAGILELLADRAPRSVILTGATAVRRTSGAVAAPAVIGPYDIVKVEGTVNADGSVAATRIDVELEAAASPRVSGAVSQVFQDVEGLVVGGVMVPIPPGCYFIKGSGAGAFTQLSLGQPVTVYGAMIADGTVPVGLRARVIVGR